MLLGATRLLRHINRLLFDRSTGIGHFAADRAAQTSARDRPLLSVAAMQSLLRTHRLASWLEKSVLVSAAGSPVLRLAGWRFSLLLDVGRNLPARRLQYVVFFAMTIDLQHAEEMNQIPSIIGLNHIRE